MQLKLDAIKKYCNKNKDFALTKASKLVGLISFGLFMYLNVQLLLYLGNRSVKGGQLSFLYKIKNHARTKNATGFHW